MDKLSELEKELSKVVWSAIYEPCDEEWLSDKLLALLSQARLEGITEGRRVERENVITELEPLKILRKMWNIKEIQEAIRQKNGGSDD